MIFQIGNSKVKKKIYKNIECEMQNKFKQSVFILLLSFLRLYVCTCCHTIGKNSKVLKLSQDIK
jgi:hypothetical protein